MSGTGGGADTGGWQTDASEIVYETPWFTIRRDEVRNQNGRPLTYSYLENAHPTVVIVASNERGEILLQRNFRYPIKRFLWEIPAGHSDSQTPLKAAKRELLEEAGLVSNDWHELGALFSAAGIAKVKRYVFLARNVRRDSDALDKDEHITERRFVRFATIEQMVRNGELQSSGVIAALYLAKLHIKEV